MSKNHELVKKIGVELRQKSCWLAVAESCTGGLIGATVTDNSGVSDFFAGGIISYSNAVKISQLGVSAETINEHGAVSAQVASEMVDGLKVLQAGAGIAVTGVAGPQGGTNEKPVGLVYIATRVEERIEVSKNIFSGNRKDIREMTVATGLKQLYSQLCT